MTLDFSQICRICLQSEKHTFDIYLDQCDKKRTVYCDMLSSCTKIKPFLEDGLPRQLCKECSKKLKQTYSFNIQCEESDKVLRSWLENRQFIEQLKSTTDIKDEEDDEPNLTESLATEELNGQVLNKLSQKISDKELLVDVKLEPSYNDVVDDHWSADDDHVTLVEIEPQKQDEPSQKDDVEDCWNADDDNVMLSKMASEKKDDLAKGAVPVKIKKKKSKGRKKKIPVFPNGFKRHKSKEPHQCDICGKVLSNYSNMKAHKICHTDQRPYKCTDCDASFRGYSALYQHRKTHTGLTPYHCEFCTKRFKRRTGLVHHIMIHTGEKPFSCEVCCKAFAQSAQLSTHMKRHKGEKSFLCQDCGKGFPIRSDLIVHQRVHSGEKPYSCTLCDKTFATSGNLSIHIRIHKKEIRYNCKECSKGFVTPSSYNVHVKRHKGQRDYQCECGKTFYTSSSLKQHKVVHTGEKKYQCKICEKRFSQTSHLSRHFKKDHAVPNMPLPSSDFYKVIVTQNQEYKASFDVSDVMQKSDISAADVAMAEEKTVQAPKKVNVAFKFRL